MLTTKELMLLQDNLKMFQDSIQLTQTFGDMIGDQQVKTLCQKMTADHQSYVQKLMKHISAAAAQ